jgi:glycosyltransferase involved in cell wall biosynthesis
MVADALRVAIDATPLLGEPTGVGVFVAGALGALARRADLGVTGYALSWRGADGLAAVLPAGVDMCRARLPAAALLRAWAHTDVPRAEWWTGPVDVVHGTNYVVPPTRRAARVVTVHDLTPVRFPELCEPVARAYPRLVRRAVARGAMVHTPSRAVAAEVVALLGVPADRVRAVAHGIDRPPAPTPNVPAGQLPAGRYVLALGRVEPRKDLPGLTRAFDAVAAAEPDVELVIAGPVGWGEGALAEAVGAAAHGDRVRRIGWVGEGAKAALLEGAALFVYPSRYEGFGLPPLEAMAAGVPVVATRAGAVPEVVGDAARLVDVGDTDGLAEAMLEVLRATNGSRTAMVAAGRRRAAEFTWDRCAEGLASLYREAVSCAS